LPRAMIRKPAVMLLDEPRGSPIGSSY
jgi:ABC-type sulfate/molybdate transport systems ATPase subunit